VREGERLGERRRLRQGRKVKVRRVKRWTNKAGNNERTL
jgi:hypothetical protein